MKTRFPGIVCLILALVLSIAAARYNLSEPAAFIRQNEVALSALAGEVMLNSGSGAFNCPGAEQVAAMIYVKDGTNYIPYVEFFRVTDHGFSGFYFSPTDIPIPFQGLDEIKLDSTIYGWEWEYQGYYGNTTKIIDCWYAFNAYL